MKKDPVDTKLAAARTRLILDKPFLGALVLRLPLAAADPNWCTTTNTDAKKIYYNYEYINQLRPSETQFVLAKQALHCALSHFARRRNRIQHRWDLACDYAINPVLIAEGFTAPPGTFVEESFAGMSAEEIYLCLQDKDEDDDDNEPNNEEQNKQQNNNQEDDSNSNESDTAQGNELKDTDDAPATGSSQPPPMSQQEMDNLSVHWQQRVAGAAQQAQQVGKLGANMARLIEIMLQPKLPWRVLLAKYMISTARDDYSYARPSSRRGEPAIFPSLRSSQIDMVVALDVSGSIKDEEMNEFLAEIDAIKGQLRARIVLLACDAQLAKGCPWVFEPWEELKLTTAIKGGGGTNFTPVFDWIALQDKEPEILVYFSDCIGKFPEHAPNYDVIWLVKGQAEPAFGRRIQLN